MKDAEAAATPPGLSSVPPSSVDDEAHPSVSGEQAESLALPRLVGPVAEPSPPEPVVSAPPSGFASPPEEHPIRARLLARARGAVTPIPADTTEPWVKRPADARPDVLADHPVQISEAPSPAAPAADALSEDSSGAQPAVAPPNPTFAQQAPLESLAAPVSSQFATPAPPPAEVVAELERIAGRGVTTDSGTRLSPNLIAVLGALLGLTVLGTLGIALGRLDASETTAPPESGASAAPVVAVPTEPVRVERQKVPGPWRINDDKDVPGLRVLRGKIGKQPFLKAIQEAGLPKGEAYRAYAALKDIKNLDRCAASDQFLALVEQGSKRLKAFEYIVASEEIYQARAGEDGTLKGAKLDLHVQRNQVRRALAYDGKSFDESAQRSGFDQGLGAVVEKALAGHMFLSELRAGDRLRVIVQELTVLGEFSRYAGVEALELLRPGKAVQRFYYYSHPQQGGYFDGNGRAPFEGGWRKPIPGAPVTSRFNMKRMHPVLHKVMPHNGTDFGAPSGTPVGATAPGTISFIGPGGPSGNLVKIKHAGGYESGYAHLSRFASALKVGDAVDRMQLIGYCGSTGRSTGPHLHFTVAKDGTFIDSESLNLDGMRVLPPSHRAEFEVVRAKYDPILDAIVLPPEVAVAAPDPVSALAPADADPSAEGDEEDSDPLAGEPGAPAGPTLASSQTPPVNGSKPSATTSAGAPTAQPLLPASPPTSAARTTTRSIFMSDADLLKMQNARDDGEVNE